ncbi:hypothetical protein GCM10011594_25680 [Nakamurella endophytica]|uniref:Serine-type D-Ala-D-Ala carboxypeptidase n=1 Tax=Nakamurella endophytica TaxID=1748367 RepID=A0A917SYV4_9ACTN|nr:hypothetical protein GCM10011594_25680 [Nakamurella endophytica]
MVVVVAVLVVAAAVMAGFVWWPRSDQGSAGPTTSTTTSSSADVVDPPVQPAAAAVKPLSATAGRVPQPDKVAARLAGPLSNRALAQFSGIVEDAATGTVLWKRDQGTPVIPGSTLKLLTAAAVLTSMSPDTRLTTTVVSGSRPGDVVLVGGGDVTLSARQEGVGTVYDGAPTVADLAAQIKAKKVKVTRILTDTTYWSDDDLADGWLTDDITGTAAARQGYITRMQPLMVDGDRTDPADEDSPRTGAPAKTAAKALARALGVPDVPVVTGSQAAPDATVLAKVQSQPVSILLSQALLNSDNVLAEALGRTVALKRGAPTTFEGVEAAVVQALEDLKLDTVGLVMEDASGLSPGDQVSASLEADVMALAVSGRVPALGGMLAGLPVAGVSGTLGPDSGRFRSAASKAGAGWVRAKTGSLGVTYALTGYVPDVDGRMLVFSFNSLGVGGDQGRFAQDAVAAALRGCGCS